MILYWSKTTVLAKLEILPSKKASQEPEVFTCLNKLTNLKPIQPIWIFLLLYRVTWWVEMKKFFLSNHSMTDMKFGILQKRKNTSVEPLEKHL